MSKPRPAVVYHNHDNQLGAVLAWCKGKIARFRAYRDWAKKRAKNATGDERAKFRKSQQIAEKKLRWLLRHRQDASGELIVTFDGLDCPSWIADILNAARKDGVSFHVISGVRSPEYSEQLCENMCGAPTCPGRCAGRGSNHAMPPTGTGVAPEGAVDVYPGAPALEAWCRAHNAPLYGNGFALAQDLNHFSATGR